MVDMCPNITTLIKTSTSPFTAFENGFLKENYSVYSVNRKSHDTST